ncbi:uncharacterized protein Dwil_GK17084 [Drosophila willistoni]|uniref:Chitin-binding type-2 domain-containing protein n=1 Tax=Drosophila willistoni TaxID=7260 RepID=B4MNA4_DROWI|nr:protein obstructor-E [Drosophila willistoni]EDW72613.2 uncharacterized protein Dwil_GK17084 [Drosophila willistoni]
MFIHIVNQEDRTMIYQLALMALALVMGSNGVTGVNICSGVADNLFLPQVNNCSAYNLCIGETAIQRVCPSSYYFDAAEQECLVAEEVKCLPTCPTTGLSSFGYSRTCNKYILCYGGASVIRQCSDGLQYNKNTDRCDYPQYVDCLSNLCTKYDDPEDIVYLASKSACDKYFVCLNGFPTVQTCSNGLQYNPETKLCDFPSNVNCTVETLQRNILPYAKAPPRSADITCPAKGTHFFAHQKRSDAYYYCQDGRGVTLDCTPGLVYDSKTEDCREPQFVHA